jgi:hypothetical protein
MKHLFAVVFLAACCVSWQGSAQHKHTIPETRIGQMSTEVVAQLLREHGFSDVANLRLDGAVYRAQATKGGARVDVEMDARSGRLLKP